MTRSTSLKHLLILVLLLPMACARFGGGEIDPDDDRSIARGVHAELRHAPVRGASGLDVEVEDGVVTLTGGVQEPSGIGDIVMRVESLPGVRRVVSNIEFDGRDRDREEQAAPPPEMERQNHD
ncbi:BON domain-containing protein [Natronospira bacteriovora]|uniref:BON domain-containing protein n=1 Tax=Natronospira bacteriovora TaxID=3069753 RepID=A0ABU0W6G6_9GAMM|nr:BON domain-containing protein [Natronospira sp. AB-CW4]MDQ2069358.1 BON domain-containing protein [Natronospira sp. AB-CW4]